MRVKNIGVWVIAVVAMVVSAACHRDEQSVTGSYGSGVVTGQVTMASSIANGSPEGVRVTVSGTGMSTVLGADGRFAFTGVPEDAKFHFTREDGIDATMFAGKAGSLSIELAANAASSSGGRRRAAGSAPQKEVEGNIKTVSATSLVVTTKGTANDVTVAISSSTVIRKGDTTLTAADLKVGDQVHVRVIVAADNTATASLIIVQQPESETGDDDGANIATANGIVASVAADSMVVHTADARDVTVKVVAATIIRRQGTTIAFSDIKVGNHVESRGTKVDATTIQAIQIEVEDAPGAVDDNKGGHTEGEVSGTVSAVGASSLTVGGITVNTDSHTVITKQGSTISLSGVKAGDRVEAKGTKVDATTLLASTIEVKGSGSDSGGHH